MENRLSERLLEFGFTKEEAEVYVFLSRMGPCPARIVARKFDINRMKAYRTLKALEEKGLVERIIGRPVRFVAAPIRETLERYIEVFKVRLSDLEKSEKEIIQDWGNLSNELESLLEEPRFRIFQGRQQVYDLLYQMCNRAVKEISIVTTGNDLNRLALLGLDDRLRSLSREGTQVRVLTQVEVPKAEEVGYYIDFAAIRHITLPAPVRFIVIDGSETLTTVAMDDSMSMTTKEDTGLWTNAPSFITVMKIFFDALWDLAPKAQTIMEALRTGKPPQEIRVIRSREDFLQTFVRMIRQSESKIDIMVDRIDNLPIPLQDFRNMLKKGIELRILTHLNLDTLREVSSIYESVQIMHSLTSSNLQLTVVDGREALLNIPFWEEMEQAVWSNLDEYVDTMIQVFEDYWGRGELAEDILSRLVIQRDFIEKTNVIKTALELSGWYIESPGQLTGDSGVSHSFNLVAFKPGAPNSLGIDLLLEEEAFNHIIRLGAKNIDLKQTVMVLASIKPFDKQEEDLAGIYGIRLIHEPDTEHLAQKINDEAVLLVKE